MVTSFPLGVAAVDQPRRGSGVEVGAERHDQDVPLEGSIVGHDVPGGRIDGSYGGPQNSHARLDDVAVGMTDGGWYLPSEHHVEL